MGKLFRVSSPFQVMRDGKGTASSSLFLGYKLKPWPGNPHRKGKLSTDDLLIKVTCFVKKVNNIFNIEMSWSRLISTRRSTVQGLPLQKGFPALAKEKENSIAPFSTASFKWICTFYTLSLIIVGATEKALPFTMLLK
jgi:hypothetical protein